MFLGKKRRPSQEVDVALASFEGELGRTGANNLSNRRFGLSELCEQSLDSYTMRAAKGNTKPSLIQKVNEECVTETISSKCFSNFWQNLQLSNLEKTSYLKYFSAKTWPQTEQQLNPTNKKRTKRQRRLACEVHVVHRQVLSKGQSLKTARNI